MPIDMQIIFGGIPVGGFRNGATVMAADAVRRTAVNDNAGTGEPEDDDDLPPSGLLTLY